LTQVASRRRASAPLTGTDELWLEMLQRLCGRVAHELKGALNGVSVNLEVVRSRCEQPSQTVAALGKYANAAGDQLGAVIAMTDALLALGRPERDTVDVGTVLRRIEALLGPAARADSRRLDFDPGIVDLGPTSARGNAVRLAISAALLGATAASTHVVCRAANRVGDGVGGGSSGEGQTGEVTGPVVSIESCDGSTLQEALEPRVVDAAASAGIHIQAASAAITISFPRQSGRSSV